MTIRLGHDIGGERRPADHIFSLPATRRWKRLIKAIKRGKLSRIMRAWSAVGYPHQSGNALDEHRARIKTDIARLKMAVDREIVRLAHDGAAIQRRLVVYSQHMAQLRGLLEEVGA